MAEPVKFAGPYLLLCSLTLLSIRSVADEFRDPTRPPAVAVGVPVAHEAAPILSAIMGPPSARVAIFNGQVVHGGGRVGEFFIEAVLEDGVRYRHAGTTQELHLAHAINAVKKPSTAAPRLPVGAP
jgi:hypothetical protein